MKRVALAFVLPLVVVGCGSTEKVSDKPETSVRIVIKDGKATPQGKRVEAKVGHPITLHVTSDRDDEVHVHSEPEHEFKVPAGAKDKTFTFSIDTPGQVAVESHTLDVTIVQLVVR
ncbi:MAG: hypothetical protein ABIR57_04600 [Aeromicrobium sp.]